MTSLSWAGKLVLADVLVGQLAGDLEFDRDEVVAAQLPRPPGRDERSYGVEICVAAECLPCSGENSGSVVRLTDCPGFPEKNTNRERNADSNAARHSLLRQ